MFGLVVVMTVSVFIYLNFIRTNISEAVVELSCSDGYNVSARYYEPDMGGIMQKLEIQVTKSDATRLYNMIPAISASGAKFETADKRYSFWEHQSVFTFALNDTDVTKCTEKK